MVQSKTYKLQKQTPRGQLYWEITVQSSVTKVKAGSKDGRPKYYPDMEHRNEQVAFRFTQKQVQKKKSMGYKMIYSRQGGHFVPGNASRYDESPYSDHDTDSTCSMGLQEDHTDSVTGSYSADRKSGVSPLNRGRLNRKAGETTMEATTAPPIALLSRVSTTYFLRSQMENTKLNHSDTIVMQSPGASTVQRMDTNRKWESWRDDPLEKGPVIEDKTIKTSAGPSNPYAELLISSPIKRTSSRAKASQDIPVQKRKKFVTSSLQLKLADAVLNERLPIPAGEQEGGLFDRPSSQTGRLKRKATTILSPVTESGSMLKKPGVTRGISKKVLVLSPEESEKRKMSSPKRQSTVLIDDPEDNLGHKSKRLCLCSPRASGSIRQDGLVYIPKKTQWPINLVSPVIWYVPLMDKEGGSLDGRTVFVDKTQCLIAIANGTVIKLDASVELTSGYKLPSGARCLLPDGDFLYAGCQDGGLYDLTHSEPRLMSYIKGFGQLLCLDVFEGFVTISDEHGNVALVDYGGDIMWRHKSKGEFGWLVKLDSTGIYHGHSQGLTKYSIQNGHEEWHLDTGEPVFHGIKTESSLYVAVGQTVIKVDRPTGKLLATFDKGKSKTATVHSLAVGAGLVFAGGNNIVCYDADSGHVVYVFTHKFKPTHMQYFQGRLFTISPTKMSVIDLTETSINRAKNGDPMIATAVTLQPSTQQVVPLKKIPTISRTESQSQGGVLVQCVKPKRSTEKVLVKALSTIKNQNWPIQLPPDLLKPGAKYMVQDLRPCPSANFYRIYGDITEVDQ